MSNAKAIISPLLTAILYVLGTVKVQTPESMKRTGWLKCDRRGNNLNKKYPPGRWWKQVFSSWRLIICLYDFFAHTGDLVPGLLKCFREKIVNPLTQKIDIVQLSLSWFIRKKRDRQEKLPLQKNLWVKQCQDSGGDGVRHVILLFIISTVMQWAAMESDESAD